MIYQSFLSKLEGNWISQKTDYFTNTKKIEYSQSYIQLKKVKNILKITEKNKNILCNYVFYNKNNQTQGYYIFFKDSKSYYGNIKKITNNQINHYIFKIYTNNCIKIEYVKNNIIYREYIYFINDRFKITISLLKDYNKYLAISFISEIKILDQN
uniref:Chromophore lyase CpcS/CpeS n=2 Tax=Gracilariopsis TaxID=2781 RepID=A0A1C9CEX6_9FLOR|nr:hypothetical protein [Gracilariopsis lemaneiformis]YP_009294652.1 hypothetical protein Gch_053 [Gracilariopsis chorda]AJO68546.1 hypothetical protein [Gracilariopsis lemaneiformis]AML79963.1 hypothetical protein [Gracilariopsis lemaneiformis]AOM66912.1 hypothetical protein Gch_053 [Gracilariopsis chorda]UAD88827.1 hypothetical protein [Gracilariopsis chorda]